MLTGAYAGLRALEHSDLRQLQHWRNNEAIRRYYRECRELNMYDQEQWFTDICCGNSKFCMFGIVALQIIPPDYRDFRIQVQPGSLIGVCGLTNINWVLRSAELSFYIGACDAYIDSVYAPETVCLMRNYAFNILNLHKLWVEVYEFDVKKITLIESMGMNKDGILRDNVFDNGNYFNSIIYSLISTDNFSAFSAI